MPLGQASQKAHVVVRRAPVLDVELSPCFVGSIETETRGGIADLIIINYRCWSFAYDSLKV